MDLTPQILSVTSARDGKDKVVFQFIDGAGNITGPYVEHRPEGGDHAAFVAGFLESMQAVPPEEEPPV